LPRRPGNVARDGRRRVLATLPAHSPVNVGRAPRTARRATLPAHISTSGVRNPFALEEVGHYIPETTENTDPAA
jgi:hypothetical protein